VELRPGDDLGRVAGRLVDAVNVVRAAAGAVVEEIVVVQGD